LLTGRCGNLFGLPEAARKNHHHKSNRICHVGLQECKETDIKLMEYIQSNPIRAKSEIILIAIRSFWLPHAITTNSGDNKQIQSIAGSCIQVLKRQAQ
jgi:hypothetical protein